MVLPTIDPTTAGLTAGLCLAVLVCIGLGVYAHRVGRRLKDQTRERLDQLRATLGDDIRREIHAEIAAQKPAGGRRSFKDASPETKRKFMYGVIGVALVFATIIVTALAMSFHYQFEALHDDLGNWAYGVPIITDAFLLALIVADLLFLYAGHSYRILRILPLGPAAFTLVLNLSAHDPGESLAGHLAPPLVVIAVSEFLRFTIIKWADLTAEHIDVYEPIPLIHWMLEPARTWKLWRRRVTSHHKIYTLAELAEFEAAHVLAVTQAEKKYGGQTVRTRRNREKSVPWQKAAPPHIVWAITHNLLDTGDVQELAALATRELFGTAVAEAKASAQPVLKTPAAPALEAPAAPVTLPEPLPELAAPHQPEPTPEREPAGNLAARFFRESPVTVEVHRDTNPAKAPTGAAQSVDDLPEDRRDLYREYEKRRLADYEQRGQVDQANRRVMEGKEIAEALGITASSGRRARDKFSSLFEYLHPDLAQESEGAPVGAAL